MLKMKNIDRSYFRVSNVIIVGPTGIHWRQSHWRNTTQTPREIKQ